MEPVMYTAHIIQTGITADVTFGNNTTVVMPVNLYGCTIGDDCFIGPFTEIQKNVTIGNRTRIQSHCFVCEKVSIGDDCFIGHGVVFVNDTFKHGGPAGDPDRWQQTVIGNHVSLGSNVTLLPVTVCDHAIIGAGAVVTKDIREPGNYAGNPARKINHVSK